MKWASDIDPTLDSYKNSSADMARVAHMVHRFTDGPERDELIGMLFGPMSPAKVRS